MKVLYYNHTGQVSGAERVLMMITGHLDRGRYEPVIVCPPHSRMMELANQGKVRTVGLDQLEARFTWRPDQILRYLSSFAKVIRAARSIVIDEQPAFIHANSIRAGMVMAGATVGLRVPVIWHAHDILPRHPISTAVRLLSVVTSRNRILAVSDAVARAFRGRLLRAWPRRTPITVIHNSVDLERFHPDEESRPAARAELGFSSSTPVIASVGQLTPRKGQLELIESFAAVTRKLPDAVLLIIGTPIFNRDEEYARLLRARVQSLGLTDKVRFLGSRDDVQRLMRAVDVLVVNSHQEPFALTVLEGLASGCAVLATAVGGTPEMISHEVNGFLVPPRQVPALADGLLRLLSDSEIRHRLGRRARQDAMERFSIARYMEELHSLYRETTICGASPRRESSQTLQVKLSAD